ncbi:MAG: hypothetical protein N3D10_03730 [Candidatus Micrarchaeota archaeon]|nr:hypothetical protein [Candidatus Micrarchaeota archaeon]
MKVVYEADLEKKQELLALLESDPYGQQKEEKFKGMSFSRLGYKIKEGAAIEEDKSKIFIIFRGGEEYLEFLEKYLKDIAKKSDEQTTSRIIQKIEDEENSAEQGMGSIFEL